MAKVDVTRTVMLKAKADKVPFWELAQELGMSSVHLSQCLRGERELAPERINKLEKKLSIKLPDKMKIKG
jgi:cyanate lyase